VSGGDDESADEHRAACADEVVREIPPEDAHQVARHGVVAVDLGRELLVETQAAHRQWGDHEQEQQRPHPIIGEPLPHLGVEKHAEPPGVSAEAAVVPLGMPGRGLDVGGQLVHRGVISGSSPKREPGMQSAANPWTALTTGWATLVLRLILI